jgi:hypothetical protein
MRQSGPSTLHLFLAWRGAEAPIIRHCDLLRSRFRDSVEPAAPTFSRRAENVTIRPEIPVQISANLPETRHRSVSYSVAMLQNVQNSQMHPVLGIFVEHASLPQLAH